mmetsp:Transcript_1117/g.1098  ORF Transcript_1117/g.1098 Transcript_1117/m.1098 type:complete len:213 (+) Transcript_1117:611-1249(+)
MNVAEFSFDYLVPYLSYLGRKIKLVQSSGEIIQSDTEDTISLLKEQLDKENNLQFKEISLPGYNAVIPKMFIEFSDDKYENGLFKDVFTHVDSETYPHLHLFEEYLNNQMFDPGDFNIFKEENRFELRNCWMIQALGTMKLLDDHANGRLLPGFEFTHFKTFKDADGLGLRQANVEDHPVDFKDICEETYYKLEWKLNEIHREWNERLEKLK